MPQKRRLYFVTWESPAGLFSEPMRAADPQAIADRIRRDMPDATLRSIHDAGPVGGSHRTITRVDLSTLAEAAR